MSDAGESPEDLTAARRSLTVEDELLHRQVIMPWVREGRLTSQAFKPRKDHDHKLSVDRESLSSAEAAYDRAVASGYPSIGVWSVAVNECATAGVTAYEAPTASNAAHVEIDFEPLSNNKFEAAAKLLSRAAHERGCQHPRAS